MTSDGKGNDKVQCSSVTRHPSPVTGAGIGLRQPHYKDIFEQRPALDFLEVHSENFFHAGGASLHVLERAREIYPISLHGVGLSLASADTLRTSHLSKLKRLVDHIQPVLVSEHLCWGAINGKHFNDLLPFPYTGEALDLLCDRVDQVQTTLQRTILIENLSAYLQFVQAEMDEFTFLAELSRRTGCGILLDVNNLYVNASNFDYDPWPLIVQLPIAAIGEIHLAGHTRTADCLIDTHSDVVCEGVWDLYRRVLGHVGAVPTLIEWDADIPALEVLLEQASMARACHAVGGRQLAVGGTTPCFTPPTADRNRRPGLTEAQTTFGAALLSSRQAESAAPLFLQSHNTTLDRLAIYRGNVVSAITKALQRAYPVIEQIVGTEFFAALARAYWQEHPSTSGDLHDYGGAFAEFVARFEHTQHLPYLHDVAQLEWAVQQAYGAADHVVLALSALTSSMGAEAEAADIGGLRFTLQAGATLLDSIYPIASIWQQHQSDYAGAIDIQLDQAEAALVHRLGDRVSVTRLPPDQFFFLQQLQQDRDLQTAVLHTLEHYEHFAADQALASAFAAELIVLLRREHHAVQSRTVQ